MLNLKFKIMLVKLVGLGAIVFSAFAFQTKNVSESSLNNADAKLEWESESIALGNIEKGVPVDIVFEFTNVGANPVILSDVKAGCGCTDLNFSKAPIPVGKSSSITATYNAKTPGKFSKSISVSSNATAIPFELKFNGVVVL